MHLCLKRTRTEVNVAGDSKRPIHSSCRPHECRLCTRCNSDSLLRRAPACCHVALSCSLSRVAAAQLGQM